MLSLNIPSIPNIPNMPRSGCPLGPKQTPAADVASGTVQLQVSRNADLRLPKEAGRSGAKRHITNKEFAK